MFSDNGEVLPVSVVQAGPCYIVDVKSKEKNGYIAVCIGFEDLKKTKNIPKPYLGIFAKKNIPPQRIMKEFRFDNEKDIAGYEVGKQIKVDVFVAGDHVDVEGLSKGRGFAGVMKRHNFSGQPASHGASDRERAPGASGRQLPQRVIKGTKKPGHYGNTRVTVQALEVVGVDVEKNLLLLKGAVPGPKDSILYIRKTVKRIKPKIAPPPPKKKVTVEKKKK